MMSRFFFAQRFRVIVNALNIVQKEFAEEIGVDPRTVSRWITGEVIPHRRQWPKIFDALGVTEEQFWDPNWIPGKGQGVHEREEVEGGYRLSGKILRIPVVAEVQAGQPREILEEANTFVHLDADLLPNGSEADYIAVRVQGDSMSGVGINEGDLAIVRLQPIIDSGQIAAVQIEGEGSCIKRVHISGDQVVLISENPKYPPRVLGRHAVRIVGRVRRVVKEF